MSDYEKSKLNGVYRDEEDEKHQTALIQFERESAAKTAALLSNGKEFYKWKHVS